MINFDISEIREITRISAPTVDFDSSFNFYYDETNNVRKFYVRETDFNSSFSTNFVLGGLVYEGIQPDLKPLFKNLNLQKNIKDIKLKHIAKGGFLDCLKSEKLNRFLKYILANNLYIHYSSLNFLYWSIVDIVDSAMANSEVAMQLNPGFSTYLKNDLYKLAKLEIDSVIELFYNFEYPNLKRKSVLEFIEALTLIFNKYIETAEFYFGLESLRQILKEAKKKDLLPFIMNEEDHTLIKDFSQFYLRPIYLFKNSNRIFDNEVYISDILANYRIIDSNEEVQNYSFVDSSSDLFIQASDILVGLIGKLTSYMNTRSRQKILDDFNSLSQKQLSNLDLFIGLLYKSQNKNVAFLHSVNSHEELSKLSFICEIRNKGYA